jgi:hypothetical protein
MGIGDRIRGFFSKRGNPALGELEAWAQSRKGIEGYIEPKTATNPTTLLLVDRSGDHYRGPVRSPADAIAFCERIGVPVYDAQVMGYPQRMRDFEKRRRSSIPEDLDRDIEELERRIAESDPPPQGP